MAEKNKETAEGEPGKSDRMNTPKTRRRRKAARPAEIIEAGLQEFAERGFAGARLEDVAARAGVVKGTIYRYFESKEALFEAAVHSRIVPILDEVGGLVDAYTGSTEDLLRMVLQRIYERIVTSDAPVLMRIIIAEGNRFPQITGYYHRTTLSKGQALLKRIVDRGIANGEFRAGPASELPIVLMAPAIVAAIWRMTFERHQPVGSEKFLEAHLDLVLHSLKQR